MKRSKWLKSMVGDPSLNPGSWPNVRTIDFSKNKRARFGKRKRALDLYFQNELSIQQILKKTGLSKPELYRIRDRALTVRADGEVWGYLACIPGWHIKSYERKSGTLSGKAGTVTRFFVEHPELYELVEAWALGNKSPDVGKVRGRRFARIWAGFDKQCRLQEIPCGSTPSRESIRRLCSRIRRKHFVKGSRLEGGKSAADIATTGLGDRPIDRAEVPYQRVQLDGHRLDGIITVEVVDADGTERNLPLERIWLLVIIDEASRAILGYQLSLASNYSSDDVLDCVANALTPWSPKQTPSSRIAYRPGAGLPSGVITPCAWRAFDSLAFDNAMAHTSTWLQERVIRTIGCSINTGRPARALSRAIVERFFRTFEEDSLHRWPSTTGSTPDDPRRNNPEEAAEALKITLEDLELIADMTIANYNVSAHKSLNGRSPLDYIRYYDDNLLALPRYIGESLCDCLPLYDREFERKIAGNAREGRRPYVTFMGANYRNEALATMVDYIGQNITLVVNVKDIRRVHGFMEDGTSIGTLNADEPWLRQPHSLRTRRAILKLIRAEELPRETYNPVGDHLEYLRKRARLNRRDRNRLISQAREANQPITPSSDRNDLPKMPAHPHAFRRHNISVTTVYTK